MRFSGASVEDLRALARLVNQQAEHLESGILLVLDRQLIVSPWVGPDAQMFADDWATRLAPSVKAVATSLHTLHDTLSGQADQQEEASAADPRAAAILGAVRALKEPRTSHTEAPPPSGDGQPREGRRGHAADLLELSDCSYHWGASMPDGWSEVSSKAMRALGIDPGLFSSGVTGFRATLFRDADGRYLVGFAGTQTLSDWVNNVANVALAGPQQDEAIALAIHVKRALSQNAAGAVLEFTGHSLGGGLAALASLATGCDASTFNAASVSPGAVNTAVIAGHLSGVLPITSVVSGHVTSYVNPTDPLTIAQVGHPAYGNPVMLTDPSHSVVDFRDFGDCHNPIAMRRAMDASWSDLDADPLIESSGRS